MLSSFDNRECSSLQSYDSFLFWNFHLPVSTISVAAQNSSTATLHMFARHGRKICRSGETDSMSLLLVIPVSIFVIVRAKICSPQETAKIVKPTKSRFHANSSPRFLAVPEMPFLGSSRFLMVPRGS